MPSARVERVVAASPAAVWTLVADPHHQPRWWPGVRRMEAVTGEHWTQVLPTARGSIVRADFRLLAREPERLVAWEQELAGTPFERLLAAAQTTVTVAPADGGGTRVGLELRQQLAGWSRLVPFLFRRAARRQLAEALDGLERAVDARGAR